MSSAGNDFSPSYDVQQVCLNGHVTNNYASDASKNQNFCEICEAKTVTTCQRCKGPIRGGHKYSPGPMHPGPDAYCLHCGKPFPWTESKLAAVRAIAEESEDLDAKDRQQLDAILPDLIAKTEIPRTQLAIVKLKKLIKKGGSAFAEALRKTLIDVVSESVKKVLFP
jgi:hypothetical protein